MIPKDFVIPQWVKVEEGATESFARIIVEPFERGYGTTVGNTLRRVLLASLEGSAVTAIRIEQVQHEFSALPGFKEDLTDVVLNFKQCRLRLNRDEPLIFSFKHKGKGTIAAGDIFAGKDLDCFNSEHVVFTGMNADAAVEMEIKVSRGRGYVTAENFELEHAPIGTVYLDANFSPVTKVNFFVEDARVGQRTDYDRLILDIWTDGSITPEVAAQQASDVVIEHFKIFVQQDSEDDHEAVAASIEDPELARKLVRPVEELELSVRAANCLKQADIHTVGQLVVRDESEMLQFHNFGKKSLDEIKAILTTMNLCLGMDVEPPTPEDAAAVVAVVADGEAEEEPEEETTEVL